MSDRREDAGDVRQQAGRQRVAGTPDADRAEVDRQHVERRFGAALKGADHVADERVGAVLFMISAITP